MIRKLNYFSVLALLIAGGCVTEKIDFYAIPKLDAHFHLRTNDTSFVNIAIQDNFRFLTIATRSSSQAYIDQQLNYARNLHQRFPDRISYATTFSMENWGQPDWQTKTIEKLKMEFKEGAIAVKVWKDIGMTFRKPDSSFIMIDDPSFDPILDFIASQGKTVVAHIAEPRNCWLPLDSMTVNSDRNYFSRYPEYHMYLHPDYPSHTEIIKARDHMLEKHPDLRVVGAHLGSLEWDVDVLAKRLDMYPSFAADMSARICHFQHQDREKVRKFIAEYQDRLLYGTDIGVADDSNIAAAKERVHRTWLDHWKYFTTAEEMTSEKVNGTFKGLALDAKIIKKIYYENAKNWFPEMP